ncbi:hypothetical protein ACFYWY_29005 [Streptomyces sp. NPDC002870]|uniref:hypothetical protein n=1 Tax=unclassified Streptomyces TaxID=2593676 RepID=UPI003680C2F8
MDLITFTVTLLDLGLGELMAWRYGAPGLVGLALLGLGIKARHHGCACAGAFILSLLLVPPGA